MPVRSAASCEAMRLVLARFVSSAVKLLGSGAHFQKPLAAGHSIIERALFSAPKLVLLPGILVSQLPKYWLI